MSENEPKAPNEAASGVDEAESLIAEADTGARTPGGIPTKMQPSFAEMEAALDEIPSELG